MGEQPFGMWLAIFTSYTHYYQNSSRYNIKLPTYGDHVKNLIKGSNSEMEKGRATFLYMTYHLNLIHVAIMFDQDIPYGYLVIARTRIVWKNKWPMGHLSEIATADMQMLCIFPSLWLQLMKGSFELFLVLKRRMWGFFYCHYFTIYGHDSQWSVTVWTNTQFRFNSRIDMKLGEIGQLISEEKVFNNIMILYMYTA